MITIDLITGFLGAGKTTFIRKYATHLMEQGLNIGILERLLLLIRTLWFLSSRDSQLV